MKYLKEIKKEKKVQTIENPIFIYQKTTMIIPIIQNMIYIHLQPKLSQK